MFFLKAAYCRIFQSVIRFANPILPYRVPKVVDSVTQLGDILRKESVRSVLIVTDKGIVENGLTDSIKEILDA